MDEHRWLIGHNLPGRLADEGDMFEYAEWTDALDHLLRMIGDVYDAAVTGADRRIGKDALEFISARSVICGSEPNRDMALVYKGEVYWLADIP